MRYFTTERYLKLQSSDEQCVIAAMEDWDRATEAYAQFLERIRAQLPPEALAIAQSDFHDWHLLMFWSNAREGVPPNELIILLQERKDIAVLSYSLTASVKRIKPPLEWEMQHDKVYWLNDEFDVAADGRKSFMHRILLSDGTTLLINFSSCRVSETNSDRGVSPDELARIDASLAKTT